MIATVAGLFVVAGGLVAGSWFTSRLRPLPPAEPVPVPASDPRGSSPTARLGMPSISVVIPARDEATSLPTLLDSLAEAAPQLHEVIVVDDASTDDTAAVARARGASVVTLDGPPPGWAGKPHACDRGAAIASGELLLFLDADVRLLPDAVQRLAAAYSGTGGLLSVQPYHRVERPYEELSAMCNAVSMIGSAAFARWPPPRRPVAFGPCLLTSVADYRAVGGHAAVRAEVVEDIALARAFDRHGLPVECRVGAGAVEFRMYPGGVRQLVEGWTKNVAAGAGLTDPLGLIAGVWFVAACATSATTLLWLAVDRRSATVDDVAVAAAMWLAVAVVLRSILRRIGSFSWATAILHPIVTVTFVGIFARSLWSTFVRRQVRWRGRRVAVGRTRQD